jgi:hypothetical protein
MRKSMAVWLAGILIVLMSVTGAFAESYYGTFPPGAGNFTFDDVNDFVTHTFTGTGLESVTSVLFNPNVVSYIFPNVSNPFIVVDVIVNGTVVNPDLGYNPLWTIRPEGAGPKRLAFSFEDILETTIGNGDYTITWDVNRLTPGSSVVLSYDTFMALRGTPPCPCPTPIPGSVVLLSSGLVGLVGLRRKLFG